MKKWPVTLSTTEPFNYIGIVKVRQGNVGTEVLEATIVENGVPYDLTGCKVTFQTMIGQYAIERATTIIDEKAGVVEYVFDEYTMQEVHQQIANLQIYKEEDLVGSTQDFSYFVIQAVSKTEGEMGSYWQSVEDLIDDMTSFINAGKGDFTAWMEARKNEFDTWMAEQKGDYQLWFDSIKDILMGIDPGGVLLAELMDARVDLNSVRHESISERLIADFEYLFDRIKKSHYTLYVRDVSPLVILQDDSFSENHEITKVGEVSTVKEDGALVVATIDDLTQDTFYFKKVGEV